MIDYKKHLHIKLYIASLPLYGLLVGVMGGWSPALTPFLGLKYFGNLVQTYANSGF